MVSYPPSVPPGQDGDSHCSARRTSGAQHGTLCGPPKGLLFWGAVTVIKESSCNSSSCKFWHFPSCVQAQQEKELEGAMSASCCHLCSVSCDQLNLWGWDLLRCQPLWGKCPTPCFIRLEECLPVTSWLGLKAEESAVYLGLFPVPPLHGPCLELGHESCPFGQPLAALSSKENTKWKMLLSYGGAFASSLLGASGLHTPSGQGIFFISCSASPRQCWCPVRLGGGGGFVS